jgi:hypothetical protein
MADRDTPLALAILTTDAGVATPLAALRFTMLRAADCSAPITVTRLATGPTFQLTSGAKSTSSALPPRGPADLRANQWGKACDLR